MSLSSVLWLIGGGIAVVWIVVTQCRSRPLRATPSRGVLVARWVLLAYGVLLVVLVVHSQAAVHPLRPVSVALLVLMAVLAVGFGILRGAATAIWRAGGCRIYRRGGSLVILLWAVSLGVHLAFDWQVDRQSGIAGLGAVTTLAYLVATIAAQNITIRRRAAAKFHPDPGRGGSQPA